MTSPEALLENPECVHCGFCLPACPTWSVLGTELDNPRGRLSLMDALESGRLQADTSLVRHLDLCLGCRACETECPSGVAYGARLSRTRERLSGSTARPRGERIATAVVLAGVSLPPWLQHAAMSALRFALQLGLSQLLASRAARAVLPAGLTAACDLLVTGNPTGALTTGALTTGALTTGALTTGALTTGALTTGAPAAAATRASATPAVPHGAAAPRIALLRGCIARTLFPHVNAATLRLCTAAGADATTPAGQRCCGALHAHAGDTRGARALARRNIEAFERAGPLDAIVVNAAGCGSHLKEYGELFDGDPIWEPRARALAARVRDALEWLAETGLPPITHEIRAQVAYHDACHLAHAQRCITAPRALLARVPGLTLLPLAESDRCCGSAGLYNIVHPEVAAKLRDEKLLRVRESGARVVAAANPGCLLQIAAGARHAGLSLTVVHPLELLDAACRPVR